METISAKLTRGMSTTIDACDVDLMVNKWQARPGKQTFYAYRTKHVGGKVVNLALHRLIFSRIVGRELLQSEKVDHANRDGLDNRRENLRLLSNKQNARNRRVRSDSPTGLRGVEKIGNRYRARIGVDSKLIHLGMFETPEAAYKAFCEAADRYYGEGIYVYAKK